MWIKKEKYNDLIDKNMLLEIQIKNAIDDISRLEKNIKSLDDSVYKLQHPPKFKIGDKVRVLLTGGTINDAEGVCVIVGYHFERHVPFMLRFGYYYNILTANNEVHEISERLLKSHEAI